MRRPGLLTAILVIAAAFRLIGIDQDLPLLFEEATPMRVAEAMWGSDGRIDPDPHFFNYPSLVIYANVAAQAAVLAGGRAAGRYASVPDALAAWRENPTAIAIASRLLGAITGVLAVWALYRLGTVLADRRVGLAGAFMLAVSPWHIAVSRTILVDGPLLLFVALALVESARLAAGLRSGTALRAGLYVGLAASAKYPGAIAAAAVLSGALAGARADGRSPLAAFARRELWLAGACAIGAFVLTSPYVLLDVHRFLDHFGLERRHMQSGHFGLDPGGAAGAYARAVWNVFAGWGVPFLLVGIGVVLRHLHHMPRSVPVAAHAAIGLVVLSSWSMYGAHYLALVVPALVVFAGFGAVTSIVWLERRFSPMAVRVGFAALAALAFALASNALGRYTAPHTRAIAREWLVEHAADGDVVAVEHRTMDLSADPELRERVTGVLIPLTTFEPERSAPFYAPEWYRDVDYVVTSDVVRGRYERDPSRFGAQVALYDTLEAAWRLAADIEPDERRGSRIRIYARESETADVSLPAALLARVGADGEGVAASFLAQIGDAALSKGLMRRATSAYRRVVELDPDRETVVYNLGTLLLAEGEPEAAARRFERAHALNPGRVETLNNLGIARLESDDRAGAREAFEAAVALDPSHDHARLNLERLGEERPVDGSPAGAIDMWLTLLHNNDGESKLLDAGPGEEEVGGISRFVAVLDHLRAEQAAETRAAPGALVVISAGDSFLAGPELAASRGLAPPGYDAIGLHEVGYDALVVGNHELDLGPDALADFVEGLRRLGGAGAPVFVSANLDVSRHPRLAAARAGGRIAPSCVLERGRRAIGIVGATTPVLPTISSPEALVVDPDVAGRVQAEVDALGRRGVGIVILVSHLQDVREDLALVAKLHDVDIVVAGGGDEVLASPGDRLVPGDEAQVAGPYPMLVTDAAGDTVRVVTTSGQYRYVGRLVVAFDAGGHVAATDTSATGPVRVVDAAAFPDGVVRAPRVVSTVDEPVRRALASMAHETIGRITVPLDGRRSRVRTMPTNLGRLVADAVLWSARRTAETSGGPRADLAVHNGGGIRNDTIVPEGELTELDVFRIVPFPNVITLVTDLSAQRLLDLLERAVSELPGAGGRYPQLSGVRIEIDAARTAGRVRSVRLDDGTEIVRDGEVVAGAGPFVVAATDFLCRGGDDYPLMDAPCVSTGVTVQDAVVAYVQEVLGGTIGPDRYAFESGDAAR